MRYAFHRMGMFYGKIKTVWNIKFQFLKSKIYYFEEYSEEPLIKSKS